MTYINKSLSFLLVISLLISALFTQFSFNVLAETRKGIVTANTLNIRESANTSSNSKIVGSVSSGATVQINHETTGQTITDGISSNVWYNITYNGITGYASSVYISVVPEYNNDPDFENSISAFPESYKPYLRTLHAQYPNWKFYADNINLTFDEAVEYQIITNEEDEKSNYKVVQNSSAKSWFSLGFGAYEWTTGKWIAYDDKWHMASREVIKHYIDPRTYLNFSSIYAFFPQNYDSASQTEEGVKKIIKGSFLENNYSDSNDTAYGGSYSKVLMEAAKSSNVSPYVLAGIILQEQGNGTSFMISGKYSGYEGYYNFFNINTYGNSDAEKAKSGLGYAKEKGWNTRSKSIIGGAKFCANNYVSANQNTYYYMNFNVKNTDRMWHQYATNIADTYGKAQNLSKNYAGLKDAELDFMIPVYKNMPTSACDLPAKTDKLNNYYINQISISGPGTSTSLTPSFNKFTYDYTLNVWDDTNISVNVPTGASYVSASSFKLNVGQNRVVLTVKSESGYTNDYVISVKADKACTLYINNPSLPVATYKKGDTNGDGQINGRDLANVQMHILSVKTLSGDSSKAADTNGDDQINGRDLANIQMHILGIKKLS